MLLTVWQIAGETRSEVAKAGRKTKETDIEVRPVTQI